MTQLARTIINNRFVNEEEKEVYMFGLTLLMYRLLYCIATIALAVLLKSEKEIFVFCLAYALIRKYAGGYHSATRGGCFILTMTIYVVLSFICSLAIPYSVAAISACVGLVGIVAIGPQGSANRILEEAEKQHFKNRLIKLAIVFGGCSLVFGFVGSNLVIVLLYTAFIQLMMQLLSSFEKY